MILIVLMSQHTSGSTKNAHFASQDMLVPIEIRQGISNPYSGSATDTSVLMLTVFNSSFGKNTAHHL